MISNTDRCSLGDQELRSSHSFSTHTFEFKWFTLKWKRFQPCIAMSHKSQSFNFNSICCKLCLNLSRYCWLTSMPLHGVRSDWQWCPWCDINLHNFLFSWRCLMQWEGVWWSSSYTLLLYKRPAFSFIVLIIILNWSQGTVLAILLNQTGIKIILVWKCIVS